MTLYPYQIRGGNGGGTSGQIIQYEVVPTASAEYLNRIIEYIGVTDSTYTNGYFYKCGSTTTYSTSVTFENAKIACSGANFLAFLQSISPTAFDTITQGSMTYSADADLFSFVGKDENGQNVATYQEYKQDFEDAGFTFTGTFTDGEVITFACLTTATTTYAWTQKDVQPAGGSSAVTSVNGQTGTVVLTATNIGSTAGTNITATTTQGAINQTDAFITTFENDASVLKTSTTLSSTIDDTTTVALSDLSAYQLDGRPSHKQAGALVVSGNVIGMIDSLEGTDALVTTIFVSTGSSYTAGNGLTLTGTEFSADTTVLATKTDLNSKQDTLTAGTNISIDSATNTISATDTTYTAGSNIQISASNEISATDTTYSAGSGLSLTGTEFTADTTVLATKTDLTSKQNTLTAGTNITIENDVISATGGGSSYTAGNGLSLNNNEFSIDTAIVATQTDLSSKQDTLTAGTNISIDSTTNTISATDTTYTAGTGIAISATNEVSTNGIFEVIDYTA